MASSSATPLAAEMAPEDLSAREAEATVKFDEGLALIKANKIDEAVELFYEFLESQTALHGELALECAAIYFKYGSCLFYKAQDEADFLGEKTQEAVDKRDGNTAVEAEQGEDSNTPAPKPENTAPDGDDSDGPAAVGGKGKGKAEVQEDPSADGDAQEGAGDEDVDEDGDGEGEEEKTDMELAWENLETARHIYETNLDRLTSEQKLTLAEVHERLAELSMEKEDFDTCMADFKQALSMFKNLLPFMEEPEDGLVHCQEALHMMESKLAELKSLVPEGEVQDNGASGPTEDIQGVLDDLRDKEVELKEVIAQNASTKEVIKNALAQLTGGLGGGGDTGAAVMDLGVVGGGSGRSRITPAPAPPTAQDPMPATNKILDGVADAENQKKKKRTLEDLMAARASRSKLLGKLYSVMQTTESQLGGGEGVEGLYGSITRNGTQEVLDGLAAHACLCEDSILVDIGAGLGRPLLHAAVSHGVRQSFGIELDKVKCDKALAFGNRVLDALKRFQCDQQPELVLGNSPVVLCSPIEAVATLSPATHAYTFWEGVCSEARQALGALFASSKTLGAISMVQRTMRCDPVAEIEGYGFGPVKLVGTCKVAMSGSGRRFTAYTFVKEGWEPPCANPMWAASHKLSHEGRVLNSPPPAKTEAAEQEAPACLSPLLPARVDIEQKPNITSDKTRRGQEVPRRGAPKQATLTSAFRAVKQRGGDAKPTAPHGGSAADEAAKTRSGRLIKPRESGR